MISFHISVLKYFLQKFSVEKNGNPNYFLRNKIYEYVPEPAILRKSVPCCIIKHEPGNLIDEDSVGLVREISEQPTEILKSRYKKIHIYTLDFWIKSLEKEITHNVIMSLIEANFSNLSSIKNPQNTITVFRMLSLGIVDRIENNTYRKIIFKCEFEDIIYHKTTSSKLPSNINQYTVGVNHA